MNALGIHHPTTEDNISNLTCASNEASFSSSSISQQPIKKKRNQPGHPDPGAEVIALSPKTLMTTNRFVCDVCNKGFQRDQNLQLHRRGHNLPWKLKQKSNKEDRRKVYICPETGCVHHDPSRALGDLTGIKKHFYRKHGEKKWKCEKCSKKYAVQSDWKAHSKICGTRDYKCDCGTLFTRRDSLITHRAFCDAVAQEKGEPMSTSNNIMLQYGLNSSPINNLPTFQIKREHQSFSLKQEIPPWLSCSPIINGGPPSLILQDFSQNHHQNSNPNPSPGPTTLPPYQHHPPPAHISATALLQKASQMGAKSSRTTHQDDHVTAGHIPTYGFVQSRDQIIHTPPPLAQEMMMMMNNAGFDQGSGFDEIAAFWNHPLSKDHHSQRFQADVGQFSSRSGNEGGDLTRDFLGLRPLPQNDIMSITGLGRCFNGNSGNETQNQTPKSWRR